MTNEEIQNECGSAYGMIKEAEAKLKHLRSICKHEDTHEGQYMWRAGSSFNAKICTYCGAVVENLDLGATLMPQ